MKHIKEPDTQEFLEETEPNEHLDSDTAEELEAREERVPSYRKINYKLRPAKTIERKMMAELYLSLSAFESLRNYRYVGLGSPFFSDFILCHKNLGINEMYSIEKNKRDEKRFNFNLPYKCIQMMYGTTSEILPNLPWDKRAIVWLDYDGKFTLTMLEDIRYLVGSLISGSIFSISFNCNYGERFDRSKEKFQKLKDEFGSKIPPNIKTRNMTSNELPKVFQTIINNEIVSLLKRKNFGVSEEDHLHYEQLFNFTYADGVLMQTIGGIVYSEREKDKFKDSRFSEYSFVRNGVDPFHIHAPNLTIRELRYLDTQLPSIDIKEIEKYGIPEQDVELYSKYYRYFPTFAEIDY
ncbi:O-methyltransferase [Paenibacillus cellulositrophicus]|uniref:O-methyltransferase n=1 Tax=Paenibacillus cellulositrophicus TaxID=562959 RepID=UPI003D98FC5E